MVFRADFAAESIGLDATDVILVPVSRFSALNILLVLAVNVDILANSVIDLEFVFDYCLHRRHINFRIGEHMSCRDEVVLVWARLFDSFRRPGMRGQLESVKESQSLTHLLLFLEVNLCLSFSD